MFHHQGSGISLVLARFAPMDENYRAAKEAFHAHNPGGSLWRIHAVTFVGVTSFALWSSLPLRQRTRPATVTTAILEFSMLVVPLVLASTVLSDHVLLLNAFLLCLAGLLRYWPSDVSATPRKHSLPPVRTSPPSSPSASTSAVTKRRSGSDASQLRRSLSTGSDHISLSPRPYTASSTKFPEFVSQTGATLPPRLFFKSSVTVYRAQAMLMTIICILAVDFPVFPREFGKTETWGTSLMDIGVGSFVFSLGLISATSLLREDIKPWTLRLRKALKRSLGILALGFVRLLMVKGVEYPEQVAEYGVHWNFFFTLGLLPVVGVACAALSPATSFAALGLGIACFHQTALSWGLGRWVVEAAGTDLFSMNKEGLISFIGYLAIFILGLDTGLYVLPPDPYFARRPEKRKEKSERKLQYKAGKCASVLASWAAAWWILYAVSTSLLGQQVSRRMANLPYVLWTAAFNTTVNCLYLLTQIATSETALRLAEVPVPKIYEAINKNSLALFLLANLLTGLVNLTVSTMTASSITSVALLLGYSAIVFAVAWRLRRLNLRF